MFSTTDISASNPAPNSIRGAMVPSTWTRPWTVDLPMPKTNGEIYEYACHEGNYGMFGILSGARAQEKDAAETAKKGS